GNGDGVAAFLGIGVRLVGQGARAAGGEGRMGTAVSPVDIHGPGVGIGGAITEGAQGNAGRGPFGDRLAGGGRNHHAALPESLRVDRYIIVVVVRGVTAITAEL